MLKQIYAYLVTNDKRKQTTANIILDSINGYYPKQIQKRLLRDHNTDLTIHGIKSTKNRYKNLIQQLQEEQK